MLVAASVDVIDHQKNDFGHATTRATGRSAGVVGKDQFSSALVPLALAFVFTDRAEVIGVGV